MVVGRLSERVVGLTAARWAQVVDGKQRRRRGGWEGRWRRWRGELQGGGGEGRQERERRVDNAGRGTSDAGRGEAGWLIGWLCLVGGSGVLSLQVLSCSSLANYHHQLCSPNTNQTAGRRARHLLPPRPHPLPAFLAAGAAGGPLDYMMGADHDYGDTFEHELLFLPDAAPKNATAAAGNRAGAGSRGGAASAGGAAADAGGGGAVAAEGTALDGTPGFPDGAMDLFELQAPVWGEAAAAAHHSRGTRSTSAATTEVVEQMEDSGIAVGVVEEVHQEVYEYEEMEWEDGGAAAMGGRAMQEGEGEEEMTEEGARSPPPAAGGVLSPSAPRRLPQLPLAGLGAGRRLGFGAAPVDEMEEGAGAGGVVRRTLDYAAAGDGAREGYGEEHEQEEEGEEGAAARARETPAQRARHAGTRPRRRLAAVAVDADTKVSTEEVRLINSLLDCTSLLSVAQ